jgi:hypothetical protein
VALRAGGSVCEWRLVAMLRKGKHARTKLAFAYTNIHILDKGSASVCTYERISSRVGDGWSLGICVRSVQT